MAGRHRNIENFLTGCLGAEGLGALNKAIVRIGPDVVADPMDLYLPLMVVPRSILAWLLANVRPMKDGEAKDIEVPGTDGAHMNVNKVMPDVYKGTIYRGGHEIHRFDRVGLPALAGHLLSVFELYDDFVSDRAPAATGDRDLSRRLGELITRMVCSNMGAQPSAPAAPVINITVNAGQPQRETAPEPKKAEAPKPDVKKDEPAPGAPLTVACAWCKRVRTGDVWAKPAEPPKGDVSHGICNDCEAKHFPAADKAEVPPAAASKPPAMPKGPSASAKLPPAPKMAMPAAPKAPAAAKTAAPKMPARGPAPKAPGAAAKAPVAKASVLLDSEDMDSTCPDCGEGEFENEHYRGCPCFAYMQKAETRVSRRPDGRYMMEFGRGWDRDNVRVLIEILKGRGGKNV